MANKFYIDSVTLVYNDSNRKREVFEGKEINNKLFDKIKNYINDNSIKRIELENGECDISIIAFCQGNLSHISIVDVFEDINYYYKNDKKSNTIINIAGEDVEENLVCDNINLMFDIIFYFAQKGEKFPKVKWLED